MVMITTVSFQLSPVNEGIKHHVNMDLSKHSRQNLFHVQKQDNCICALCLGSLTLLTLGCSQGGVTCLCHASYSISSSTA